MNTLLTVSKLYDIEKTSAAKLFKTITYPWEALDLIKNFILSIGPTLSPSEYYSPSSEIWISRNATVAESACINAPCIIEAGAEIRHCAYIRGSALIGAESVVGNSTELKNVILFNSVQVPHYNYVGDSVLGYKSHMGAGAITSNVKSDKSDVTINFCGETIATGRRKIGAMIGDGVEIGCNSVLCPGAVIGKNTVVYPLSRVRGYVEENSIYKSEGNVVKRK